MKKNSILALFALILIMVMGGCANMKKAPKCQFETLEQSQLGDAVWQNDSAKNIRTAINENTVKVNNQSVKMDEYLVTLEEYFYEKTIPFVIYQLKVTNLDGTNLTDEKFAAFQEKQSNHKYDFYQEDLGASINYEEVKQEDDGTVTWRQMELLNSIDSEGQYGRIGQKDFLKSVNFWMQQDETNTTDSVKVDKAGSMNLPEYGFGSRSIFFDTNTKDDMFSIKISKFGISIVYAAERNAKDYPVDEDSLPAKIDSETYTDDDIHTIYLCLKGGEQLCIKGFKKSDVLYTNSASYIENNIACFNALWKEDINIRNVESVVIDGVEHKVAN